MISATLLGPLYLLAMPNRTSAVFDFQSDLRQHRGKTWIKWRNLMWNVTILLIYTFLSSETSQYCWFTWCQALCGMSWWIKWRHMLGFLPLAADTRTHENRVITKSTLIQNEYATTHCRGKEEILSERSFFSIISNCLKFGTSNYSALGFLYNDWTFQRPGLVGFSSMVQLS